MLTAPLVQVCGFSCFGVDMLVARVGKNRLYSISILFTFCSSNALKLLLFSMSVEYGLVFTFFRLKSIFNNRIFSSRLFYLTLVNLKCLSECHSFFC